MIQGGHFSVQLAPKGFSQQPRPQLVVQPQLRSLNAQVYDRALLTCQTLQVLYTWLITAINTRQNANGS